MAPGPFDDLPRPRAGPRRRGLCGAGLRVCAGAGGAWGRAAAGAERFRSPGGYAAELTRRGCAEFGPAAEHEWQSDLIDWEETIAGHLPIRTLRRAGGPHPAAGMVWVRGGAAGGEPRVGRLFSAPPGAAAAERAAAGALPPLLAGRGGGRGAAPAGSFGPGRGPAGRGGRGPGLPRAQAVSTGVGRGAGRAARQPRRVAAAATGRRVRDALGTDPPGRAAADVGAAPGG